MNDPRLKLIEEGLEVKDRIEELLNELDEYTRNATIIGISTADDYDNYVFGKFAVVLAWLKKHEYEANHD